MQQCRMVDGFGVREWKRTTTFSIITGNSCIHTVSIPIDTFQDTESTHGTAAKWTIAAIVRVRWQTLWFTTYKFTRISRPRFYVHHNDALLWPRRCLCASALAMPCSVWYANNVTDCFKNWTSSFYARFSLNVDTKNVTRQPDAMICSAGFFD